MARRVSCVAALIGMVCAALMQAQSDPGPRSAPTSEPKPIAGLSDEDLAAFRAGLARFRQVYSVSGTEEGAPGVGLGPRFNLNSCAGCHAHPVTGGASPWQNPQIAVAKENGAQNTIPAFVKLDGPIRVVRYAIGPNGQPDGGVHDLFTVTGRADAKGCTLSQPNFAAAVSIQNAFFRIPTPVQGAGLIEAISEASIMSNLRAGRGEKNALQIAGHENRSASDGTITRFGWKAQNKSLVAFAAEALNVEQGVTNDEFPHEREDTPGCLFNPGPEDRTTASLVADFMRYLAPPEPAAPTPSSEQGRAVFSNIGCAECHTPTLLTGKTKSAALSEKQVALYSDLALHNMGTGLEDFIDQGRGRGRDWRTAPLWGLGQRIYLMHDGRTTDLAEAIKQHGSNGSEGVKVVAGYQALSVEDKQALLNFLRSL